MKNIYSQFYLVSICCILLVTASCQKQFLEKPTGSDLNVDSIFATKATALGPIAQAYSQALAVGFPFYKWILQVKEPPNDEYGMLHGTIANIANESYYNYNWAYDYKIYTGGMTADNGTGAPLTEDAYIWNWTAIRACYLTLENIDLVSDMSETEKNQVKAEMKTLIAYRYQEMLKRYGGVPIVTKSLTVADDIKIPRSSIEEMVNFITGLCDEAAPLLPNSYPDDMVGRVTAGVALSIKAEALMFAARPLFNSSTPYLSLGGENDKFVSYGNYDANRWQKAVDANLAVLNWAAANNHHLINTGSPMEDYGVATSEPGNPEIILAYKYQYPTNGGISWNTGLYYWFNPHADYGKEIPISFNMLQQYRKIDGTDQTWTTASTAETAAPYSEYSSKCDELEPRFKASVAKIGGDALNNPGDLTWKSNIIGAPVGSEGCGVKIKFWANAGARNWFEFPIYRLAENYLNLAEAYNELGNSGESQKYLDIIRERGGIAKVTESNKDLLRQIIQKEWAVEFFQESHRLYDIKHWKIASQIMGVPRERFRYTYSSGKPTGPNKVAADFAGYYKDSFVTGFWSPSQYLVPFPVKEINKGYLVQNPGY
jgi:hypothetical protein